MSAIREATKAELADHGYAGVTFEGVARRVQTSKPVLYRRYTSRAHMVFDALSTIGVIPELSGSQGSLRADLLATLGALLDRFQRIGIDTYRGLIGEADNELVAAVETGATPRLRAHLERVLSEARQRGELGPNPIPDRAAMAIFALLRHELFFGSVNVDAAVLTDIIDTVYLPLIQAVSGSPTRPAPVD
ncbi:TetR family transcriptional regulator [Mycolicibacterium sp. GF69]|uniref:TetR/AcrR family transcriptional regulator n=1 Tax=Mycolicibacterium sp. GF69 TaxID=2267251 RepID=UPI000DCF6336|nr:TetR/AcrR family transcriptional regulator [Mycolicibacterium sp. GF69]RAV08966.1 TetR family transcriptional regulator [Mycolicibacterium sp. GF69]